MSETGCKKHKEAVLCDSEIGALFGGVDLGRSGLLLHAPIHLLTDTSETEQLREGSACLADGKSGLTDRKYQMHESWKNVLVLVAVGCMNKECIVRRKLSEKEREKR